MEMKEIAQRLRDQQKEVSELLERTDLVSRVQSEQFQEILSSKLIKVIIGIRRCGKSTLVLQNMKGAKFLYFNFDDEIFAHLEAKDLQMLLEQGLLIHPNVQQFVFDEIQNVEGWELFINRLKRRGYQITVTGSNSRLLSQELSTHLTGRHLTIELFPFSFEEYLVYRKILPESSKIQAGTTEEIASVKKALLEYIEQGGFPEILDFPLSSRAAMNYLKELYDRIVSRDIIQRKRIKNSRALREVSLILMSGYSSKFTYQSLKKQSSIQSVNTIKNYVDLLQMAYIGFVVEPFSFKVKERISLPKKFYLIDTSFADVLLGKTSSDMGKKLENIVFLQLRRQGLEIYYLHQPQYEVDFVIRQGRTITELYQVAWSIQNPETRQREVKALVKAAKQFPKAKLFLLTFEEQELIQQDGVEIQVYPVWKWLLQKPLVDR